ncbi:MAG TPA: acyl-CoA dehydrogenase family protein [Candidatus Deferrimicrobium sp.]|nr:acyl-CoA dehydrogenase family protein [Candidatus Deferrimicrobium sp.]
MTINYTFYPTLNVLESREETEFRKEVREWVLKEVYPESDRVEHEKMFPRHLFKKMGDRGYLRVLFPKSIGGTEKGIKFGIILADEISWCMRALTAALDCSIFCSIPIMRFGSEDQVKKYLPGIISGEKIGAIGMTEPSAGSDVIGSMRTIAKKDANGDYIINGEKRFITNGSHADIMTLWAITDTNVPGHIGMSAFIVEKATKGLEIVGDFNLMGVYGLKNTYMQFKDMKIPKENLLGKEGMGTKILLDELDSERTLAAAGSCGLARRAIEIAARHATKRIQFKQPIRNFEAISFQIADMAIKLEAARNIVYQAACVIDAELNASKIGAIAKVFASDIAFECAHTALQICGGLGYMKGEWDEKSGKFLLPDGSQAYVAERIFRGSRLSSIVAGTNEILRYLIQREVFHEMQLKPPAKSGDWGD